MPAPRHMTAVVAAMLPAMALAQPVLPQPGLIERVAPTTAPPRLQPPLAPPEPARLTGPGETRRVPVARVVIEGNTALRDAALRPLVTPLEGREATLAEIESARLAVLRAHRAAGLPYVAVTARLAAMPDGLELRLAVTEGSVAELVLKGDVEGRTAELVRGLLAPVLGVAPLPAATLERALLLLSDVPGLRVQAVLRPAATPGALQLVVRLSRRPVSGFASLDNRGHVLTGAWQGLVVAQANLATRFGERTELALLGTDGAGQGFVQLAQEALLGTSGLRLRAHAGAGRAQPGGALAAIGYAGETRVAGLALIHPLVRSRALDVSLVAQVEAFESEVRARGGPGEGRVRQSHDAVRALRVGLDGAVQDGWGGLGPAATTFQLRLHRGIEALGASEGGRGGTARAGSDFGFTRVTAEATRLQPLFAPMDGWLVSLQGGLTGGWSSDVLPPAEKFHLGGNRIGRGFHAGQVAGDRAFGFSAEIQAGTVVTPLELGVQFYLFRDGGSARDNGLDGAGQRVASWGGGVRLQFGSGTQLDLEATRRLTRNPDGAGTRPLPEDVILGRLLLRF
ncbi:MAG TPA: ShlB/FhaC/HecB family hemolysin secretion/activation protein [Acetobacteraceae bacterium]|nr:ShlB/FhaC/HecB family hemolysin secretion/activation protein [Acetobacteraceae bacterium]